MKGILSIVLIAALSVVLVSGGWFFKGYSGGNYDGYAVFVMAPAFLGGAAVAVLCSAVLAFKFRARWAIFATLAAGPLVFASGRLMRFEHEWNAYGAKERRELDRWLERHPVARAVEAGDTNTLARTLVATTKAEIDAPNDEGVAAIHLAAQHGYLEMVKMLLDKGATQSTSRSGTPLDFAVRTEHLDVAALLIERGGQPSEIEVVARILWWKPELIDGFTLDAVTTEGAILYVIFGQAGRHDSLALAHLSRFPFDPDAVPRLSRNVEPVDRTLLGYAIQQFTTSTAENPDERKRAMQNLRWLLANKADPNHAVESKAGTTPLRFLLMGQMRDWGTVEDTFMVIGDLLARGARIDNGIARPSRPEDACSMPALFLSNFRLAVMLAFEKSRRGEPPRSPTSDELERLGASASTSVVDGFMALLERFAANRAKIIALDSCVHAFQGLPPAETLSQIEAFLPARHRARYRTLIDSMR